MTDVLTATTVIAVCAYLFVTWWRVGRDPKPGVLVTRYEPPTGLSPAMLRYVWKEAFDDRTFWAAVLSLVSKGLATLEPSDGDTRLRPTVETSHAGALPEEERLLLNRLLLYHGHKGTPISMFDGCTEYTVMSMAASLRQRAVGRWFRENRESVMPAAVLSLVPVCVAASPQNLQQWLALIVALGVMAPGGFYLVFSLMRLRDLLRAARSQPRHVLSRSALLLVTIILPCIAALVAGGVVLLFAFGWRVLAVGFGMVALNLLFLHLMKAPTGEGRKLLDEIEGFRQFLNSVDMMPMDRPEAPSKDIGLYEQYLPYAVALDVEQKWSDRFVALASTQHAAAFSPGAHTFYLGMWNDKPVEVVYRPGPSRYQ